MESRDNPGLVEGLGMTEERLRAFGTAWAHGDVEELMAFMTDDCEYSASVGPEPGNTYVGREAVRRGFEEMLRHDAKGRSRDGRVFIAGDRGAAEWSYEYGGGSGRVTEVRGCDLFEFRGDRIKRKDAYRKTYR